MPVNTAALKTFAPAMRRQLLEAVGRKLDLLLNSQTPDTLSTYAQQIAELREQEEKNRDQLLERVAYTWFNRLCALRYLDARGWHPFGCKVLMPAAEGETQPELLKLMRAGNLPSSLQSHTDQGRLHGLLDGQIQTAITGADPQGEVYRQLVLAVCRCYHELLPNLFEGLDDASELLLPGDLLSDGSIVGAFRKEITDDDCQDVESLGWLYQFYIAEKKDEVMARKKAVPTEDIPAVTQLFTPHWIVRYLVENALGRLWLLNRPGSKLRDQMPYYIEGDAETDFLVINKPEEIKLLDPACGSGHMLTYAFELLVLIYEEEGYSPNEIPGLILKHNLHGLEICPRAAQLAELALVFKAREQSRRFFQPEQLVRPQIIELQDVKFEDGELNDYIEALDLGELFDPNLFKLLHQFEEAKTFGSLIQPCLDERAIANVRRTIGAKDLGGQFFLRETHLKVLRVLEQAEALTQRYHVAVANPPYMGGRQLNPQVKEFSEVAFPDSTADTFAMFISRAWTFLRENGCHAMVTMESWMFLPSFSGLRNEILTQRKILSMVHMPYLGKGGTAMGISFGTVASVMTSRKANEQSEGVYQCIRFYELNEQKEPRLFPTRNERYRVSRQSAFLKIPDSPIAYWIGPSLLLAFSKKRFFGALFDTKQGFATGNNDLLLRSWHEVQQRHICFDAISCIDTKERPEAWYPYSKGGPYRKWYGNQELVVNWHQDGRHMRNAVNSAGKRIATLKNLDYQFREAVTWSLTSSREEGIAARHREPGFMFDTNGMSAFQSATVSCLTATSLLCSKVSVETLKFLNPTLAFQSGDIARVAVCSEVPVPAEHTARMCVNLARADWDNFETSWDFRDLPLLRSGDWEIEPGHSGGEWKGWTLANSWANYASYCGAAIKRMQALETENNHLWIDAYGLQDELNPSVPEDEITLARAEVRQDIAGFLSYASGCMMGRYSLDQPGLILADSRDSQAEQLAAYEENVGKPLSEVRFKPDPDGIIPVLDGEWFEDDIVARTREFLAVTFPESSVAENLRFIEESLGKDIRKYFCSEFYKDHLQTYKKRPIYWLVQSPKKGFACLIYLHRYTKDTLNQVLNNYFRPYLQKLEARLAQLGLDQLNDDLPTRERTAARKEAEKITKVLKECQAWEQDALLPLAQQRIELDLDDGVKVNYLKLQDVLAPIPGLAAKED
jgi:hypothetical protein